MWVKSHLKVSHVADHKSLKIPFYAQLIFGGLIPAFPPAFLEMSSDLQPVLCEIFPHRLCAGAEETPSPGTFSLASNWQSTCTHMTQNKCEKKIGKRDKLLSTCLKCWKQQNKKAKAHQTRRLYNNRNTCGFNKTFFSSLSCWYAVLVTRLFSWRELGRSGGPF